MKFMLVLVVCTATYNDCDPGMKHKKIFDNWKECIITGHKESIDLIKAQPAGYVDENGIYIKFYCDKLI